jgi:hypothetical protein
MGRLLMSRDWMMRVASLPAVMTPLPLSPLNAARQFREKIAVICFRIIITIQTAVSHHELNA